MRNKVDNIIIPDFQRFLRKPHTINVKIVDPTRMRVIILLDGENFHSNSDIILLEDREKKILETTDGQNNCVLCYQKDGFSFPASIMGFDRKNEEIIINQIQGLKEKK